MKRASDPAAVASITSSPLHSTCEHMFLQTADMPSPTLVCILRHVQRVRIVQQELNAQ